MVDNSSLPVASGNETFANNDIGGVKYPRQKVTWGPAGTANDTDVATGKPLPTQIRSATGLIPLGEPTDAAATATDTTSVSAISIWKQISKTLQAAVASAAGRFYVQLGDGTTNLPILAGLSGAPATSAPALAVSLRDVLPAGQSVMTTSSPVAIASDQSPVAVKGNTIVQAASSTVTRPADTTAYASGDLVANSTTAGSVTNLQFTTLARVSGGSGVIVGAQIQKSSNVVTNAAFRLHLFNTAPTYTSAGDNSALSTVVVASAKGYLGYVDITAMVGFSDVAWGSGAPDNSRGSIPYVATAQIIYGLLEARGAYTPISGEVFTISLDALQD